MAAPGSRPDRMPRVRADEALPALEPGDGWKGERFIRNVTPDRSRPGGAVEKDDAPADLPAQPKQKARRGTRS